MIDWMRASVNGSIGRAYRALMQAGTTTDAPARDMYALLWAFYTNNGVYDYVRSAQVALGFEDLALKSLRNPALEVVEFYVAHGWPGRLEDALQITTENERIIEPIQQVWSWSNWSARRPLFWRRLACLGDAFIKVVAVPEKGRVHLELTDPAHVTDFDVDERDFLTWCRIDVPQQRRVNDRVRAFTYTEVWSKADGILRIWEHDQGPNADLDAIGTPTKTIPLAQMGIDFVPIVHVKFRSVGDLRGSGAFQPALEKIVHADALATRLAQMLFRHGGAWLQITGAGTTKDGAPLPALRIKDGSIPDAEVVRVGEDKMLSLPGGYRAESMVAAVNYDAQRNALLDHMASLATMLPELQYGRTMEQGAGDLSGRALRFLLGPAIARVEEARGNAEQGLSRANQMALTLAAFHGLPGFTDLGGTFDDGTFEHSFKEQDVIPLSDLEKEQERNLSWQTAGLEKDAGVSLEQILRERGFDEQQIAQIVQENEARAPNLAETMLTAFDRGAP